MINAITLEGLLPRVFMSEPIPQSEIWMTSVTFRRGGRYMVESRSGGGKSSMLSFIFGLRKDYEGEVLFDGKDTSDFSISRWQLLRRESLAYLPQEMMLFPELTAWENIQLKNSLTGFQPENRIMQWMACLGIDRRRDWPAGRMSVGQMQRVALVRALCQPFDFLLLDEPVSHLDDANNRIAAEIVDEEATRQGAAVISTSVGNPLALKNAAWLKL